MKMLKFTYNYSKLENELFTTIRRRDKYSIGERVKIITPRGYFYAEIIKKKKIKLKDIPTDILLRDTDAKTRKEAENLLNSFYRKPIAEDEILTIYLLQSEGD